MGNAAQYIQRQREALVADVDKRLSDNPGFAQRLAAASAEEQAAFRADVLEKAAQKPEYRAYALLRQSGFAQAIDKFDRAFGLSDAEADTVLQNFIDGAAPGG